MNPSAVVERRRRNPHVIGDLVAHPAFLYGFQVTAKQLGVGLPSRYGIGVSSNFRSLNAIDSRVKVCSLNRLLLMNGGRLCAILAQRLLCFNSHCAVRDALRLGTSVISQRHFFDYSSATCVATLAGHSRWVNTVAFHPTAPLLVTGSEDSIVRLWH